MGRRPSEAVPVLLHPMERLTLQYRNGACIGSVWATGEKERYSRSILRLWMLEKARYLVSRHIRPINALQEGIYGLIMALATISVVSLTIGLHDSTRTTIALSALGVNITWGLADMLIIGTLESLDRACRARLADRLFSEPDEDWALEAVRKDLEGTVVDRLDPVDRSRIYLDILESGSISLEPCPRFGKEVFKGAGLSFAITVIAALPAVSALMLIGPVVLAFQAASTAVVVLLFLLGFAWAPVAGVARWKVGLALSGIGLLIALSTLIIGG